MRTRAVVLALLVLVSGLAITPVGAAQETESSCSYPMTRTDATGTAVTVESPPARVVALGPSAAQTMWEIDAADQVVGLPVGPYTSYLAGADERVDVMNPDGFTVNAERVVNLSPDLVLAPNIVRDDTVQTLRHAGLTVYKFRFAATIDDVENKTRLFGRLTDNCASADARVDWMESRLDVVREAVAGERRPSVIYPLGGGFVAGEGTFLHEIIRAGGGRNAAAGAGITGYGQISLEVIVTQNPEWLVLNEGLPMSAIQLYAYNHTTAIRQNQIVRLNPNYANQPAPRVVLAVATIAKALHPGAYAEANATTTATPTPSTSTAASPVSPTETPRRTTSMAGTESGGQSGFGQLVTILAVVLVVAARRRYRRN